METPRKFHLFYPPCEGRFRNLAQGLLHNVSSYSLARRTLAFPFAKILFLTRERLARWNSRPLSVYSIFFIIGRYIIAGRGPFLFCLTELLFQIINLSLHGFFITLLMNCMTFRSKTISTGMDCVQTIFLMIFQILLMLKIKEFILLMNVGRFRLVRARFMWT